MRLNKLAFFLMCMAYGIVLGHSMVSHNHDHDSGHIEHAHHQSTSQELFSASDHADHHHHDDLNNIFSNFQHGEDGLHYFPLKNNITKFPVLQELLYDLSTFSLANLGSFSAKVLKFPDRGIPDCIETFIFSGELRGPPIS